MKIDRNLLLAFLLGLLSFAAAPAWSQLPPDDGESMGMPSVPFGFSSHEARETNGEPMGQFASNAKLISNETLNSNDSMCACEAECACNAPCGCDLPAHDRKPGFCSHGLFQELSFFAGVDGSKQPQDYGVNANLGGQANVNWGLPLLTDWGLGLQIGSGYVATANAVRVYELLGEESDRTQSYSTVGFFQRTEGGFAWGCVYDFLFEDSFDDFALQQLRIRGSYDLGCRDQIGATAHLSQEGDTGLFGTARVKLDPISQGSIYWRHYWETGTQTSCWIGIAEGHGENNPVTGPSAYKDDVVLIGADFLAPLNDHFALYGETNLMMPADTGVVDAYLGIQWFPGGGANMARRGRFSPLLPVAAPTSFAVDLSL